MKDKLLLKMSIVVPILLIGLGIIRLMGDPPDIIKTYANDRLQVDKTIKGEVNNEEGEPLIGATVRAKGSTQGTLTDSEGQFEIVIPNNINTLIISYIGYEEQEINIEDQTEVSITLNASVSSLEEVVVVGYGTQRKKDLTGSITSLEADSYENQPVNRVDQILQGRTPGVNVTNTSGAPGGAVSIRIRGANSINGNNDPLYVVDGFVGADFRNVNPSDIESIQILKDASATAIYGSRGANGVVLITTKSGRAGEPKLSFTARFITSEVLDTWDLLDAASFAEIANERNAALGSSIPFTEAEIEEFRRTGGTNWQDQLLRRGNGQEYQLDYSGGNESITYFISGNFFDQEGIIVNSDFQRYSLRTNIKANLSDKLTADLKVNFIRRENNNTSGSGNTSGPIAGALAWAPTTPVRDANGVLTLRDPISSIKANPLELAQNDNIRENNTANANGYFRYEFIEGLSLNVGFGIRYGNEQLKNFSRGSISDNPSASRGSFETIFLQNTNTLNFQRVFNDVHNLDVTAVVEHQSLQTDEFRTDATGLQFPELRFDNITLANSLSSFANKEQQNIRSYIGRINYAYDDKYILTAAIRADGSSKFRGDNQFGYFPSVALGWRISEETFLRESDLIDDLKLRASYGQTGSQAIPVFGTITSFQTSTFAAGTSFQNGQVTPGIIIGNPGNENLKWETTEQYNVGIDFQIFDSRLGIVADYFVKNTTDLLLEEPLPDYSGGGSIFRNLGEVENTGFEFAINAMVFETPDFTWSTSFNASFLTNEVVNIGDREQIFVDGDAGAGITNLPEGILVPGRSLSNYYGLRYLGVWQVGEESQAAVFGARPGDSRYEDLNGDGVIGGDDYQIIGTGLPDQIYGWNNTFTYKNFVLNVFFNAMRGYDKWNFTYGEAIRASADAREITHSDILNRWSPSNSNSDIPAFSETDVSELQSSRFVESGNFIRLKNLSLAYNLPETLIPGIRGSIMVSANNLLTITDYRGIDPETFSNRGPSDARGADGGSYPNAKIWTFGINIIY